MELFLIVADRVTVNVYPEYFLAFIFCPKSLNSFVISLGGCCVYVAM